MSQESPLSKLDLSSGSGAFVNYKNMQDIRIRIIDRAPMVGKRAFVETTEEEADVKTSYAFNVYMYEENGKPVAQLKVLEAKISIMEQLQELDMSPDWGDISKFDIRIKKSGTGFDTTYTVTPIPDSKENLPGDVDGSANDAYAKLIESGYIDLEGYLADTTPTKESITKVNYYGSKK